MSFNRFELKADAKAKIKAARPSPYPATIFYLVIIIAISVLENVLNARFDPWMSPLQDGITPPQFSNTLFYSMIFLILLTLISNFISVGYTWFTLRISRTLKSTFSNLFDTFNLPLKIIGLSIVIYIFTLLWFFLFIVPGIIAAYSYRQAFYILYDHPDYSIMQCIRESKAMMKGYKFKLFVLDLSFIGWVFLSVLTLCILFVWTMPYFNVTYANFYNDITPGHNGKEPFNL